MLFPPSTSLMFCLRGKRICVYRSAYEYPWILMARNIAAGHPKLVYRHSPPYAIDLFRTSNHVPADKHFAITKRKDMDNIEVTRMRDYVRPTQVIEGTSHRDGSIYKHFAMVEFCHITERDETPREPMMFSEPTNGLPSHERCHARYASNLMQIFSLKLAKLPANMGSIQLYGYIAARDAEDSLLNCIVNYRRDDPIIVQQGSPIEMTGPKRGISFSCSILLEFDLRIKKGKEEDDLQLIDGTIDINDITTPHWKLFTTCIEGDSGAVDIIFASVYSAVEATIQVIISKVHSGFDLSLSAFVFIDGSHERIQLFRGTINESCGLRRSVIAVEEYSWMHMKLEVGRKSYYCSFKTDTHGCACKEIMLDLATISVKAAWSTRPVYLEAYEIGGR